MHSTLPPYHVRISRRAQRIYIKVIPGYGVEVVLPEGVPPEEASAAVSRRKDWILQTILEMESQGVDFSGRKITLPEELVLQTPAQIFTVKAVQTAGAVRLRRRGQVLQLAGDVSDKKACFEKLRVFLIKHAREHLIPRLRTESLRLGLSFDSATVRLQKTRWGSCSVKKKINLNAALLFLPQPLVQQVFVHELCHTLHMNHSAAFWKSVEKYSPDYRTLEKELGTVNHLVPSWLRRMPPYI